MLAADRSVRRAQQGSVRAGTEARSEWNVPTLVLRLSRGYSNASADAAAAALYVAVQSDTEEEDDSDGDFE